MAPTINQVTNNGKPIEDNPLTSLALIDLEHQFGAHNYHPLPVVFDRAQGCKVWDPEGNEYIDCLSAYSAVNQGHCHPRILKALIDQSSRLTLSSRAFHNSSLGPYLEKLCLTFGYSRALPMNTGVEAVETALKLARKWAYMKKGVPDGKAIILSVDGNFHGRTLGVIGMSTDPDSRNSFGPFLNSIGSVCPINPPENSGARLLKYNNLEDIEKALQAHGKYTAAILLEPIQGEAGVVVPDDDYLPKVKALCTLHNVLLILDEVQTGLGRTGKLLCQQHSNVRADITTLGKALSGGFYPVSAVLADVHIMDVIKPGEHGSTFGGNPLGCAVAVAALNALIEENMCERAEEMGQQMRNGLLELKSIGPSADSSKGYIQIVRGKGLLNAIVIDPGLSPKKRGAWELCLLMKSRGVLAKPTHSNIIRLAPPLIITSEEVKQVVKIIGECLQDLDQVEEIVE